MTLQAKTAAAIEPPKNTNISDLHPLFRNRLIVLLQRLADEGKSFRFNEGLRTVARQQWLYGQGRPNAKPYGRAGVIVTKADGIETLSNHQSGNAADCYPCDPKTGKIIWEPPPDSDPIWTRYAELARECGLRPGAEFGDLPHVEMPKGAK